jgi:hypothetical protein
MKTIIGCATYPGATVTSADAKGCVPARLPRRSNSVPKLLATSDRPAHW